LTLPDCAPRWPQKRPLAQAAERELVQARALASCAETMIRELKPQIARLRRDRYGISSENAGLA